MSSSEEKVHCSLNDPQQPVRRGCPGLARVVFSGVGGHLWDERSLPVSCTPKPGVFQGLSPGMIHILLFAFHFRSTLPRGAVGAP